MLPEQSTSGAGLNVNPVDRVIRRDRVIHALSRFVFPGVLVPRSEMADAVLAALDHGDDYAEHLPAKHIVRMPDGD